MQPPFIRYSPHAAAYVKTWRLLKQAMIEHGSDCSIRKGWDGWPSTVGKEYREVLKALDRRINARAGLNVPRGKKDCIDWYYRAYRDQQAIQRHMLDRVRIYQFETRQCRERFAHLLSSYDD